MSFPNHPPPPRSYLPTPRFNTLSRAHHVHAALGFWEFYSTQLPHSQHLPEQLRWRKAQLLSSITDVLQKLQTHAPAQIHLRELPVLQAGWDEVTVAIERFEARPYELSPSPTNHIRQVPIYVAVYANFDNALREDLHGNEGHDGAGRQGYGLGTDPLRPDVAEPKREGMARLRLGPIYTDPRQDEETPTYTCGVEGCKGAWWFASALRTHQMEVPHCMIGEPGAGVKMEETD